MSERFIRTEMLMGQDAVGRLSSAHVAVFGIGGVGGYIAEVLARSGVGKIDLIDNDRVSISNMNRQIIATDQTVGSFKVDAFADRIMHINPECTVTVSKLFYLPENANQFAYGSYDYIADAMDTVTAKLQLAEEAQRASVPIISAMGTGNKFDASKLRIDDIYNTSVCPLARIMRKECRRRGIQSLKVVYSTEEPITPAVTDEVSSKRSIPGSVPWVPAVAGFLMAGEIVLDLTKKYR